MPLHPPYMEGLLPHNFMLRDALGSLLAVLAFAVVLYPPGYLFSYATDLFGFRGMNFADRSLWAIACSLSIVPIAAYLVGRAAGLRALCWSLVALAFCALPLLPGRNSRNAWSRRDRSITALVAVGWTALAFLLLIDAQVGRKLYFSVVMADQSYRIAFTDAVVRTGVPPGNPLYFAGSPAPMPYYYFWYLLCATVVKLAHVSARQSFIAGSVWAGFALMATVELYTRHFFRWGRKQRWIALGLLLVSGADLVPAIGQAILQPSLNGDSEWWSVDPMQSWPASLLWVPHHVAGALCCLLAFIFLWHSRERTSPRDNRWAVVLAASAFASAFGLSVYVAFGFALLMVAWCVRLALLQHPERFPFRRRAAIAGALSAVMLAPFLFELAKDLTHLAAADKTPTAPATHLFTLSVRRMIDSGLVTGLPIFTAWNRSHPVLLDGAIRLLLLLPGLAMELGLYGAVLLLLLMAERRRGPAADDEARRTSLFFAVAGLVMVCFLSSSVITNNDFGYRAVLLPQFFLLLLAADVLGSWWLPGTASVVSPTPSKRKLLYSLLALGAAGSLYWAFLLRAWLPIETAHPQNGFGELPEDEFQIRQAFVTLDRVAPADAVVAFRPIDPTGGRKGEVMTPGEFYQRMLVMDAGRQMLNAEGKCATHFGGDPQPCSAIGTAVAQLYADPAPSAAGARAFCSRFGVQYLAVGARDPIWRTVTGWPRSLPEIAAEPRFRILLCR